MSQPASILYARRRRKCCGGNEAAQQRAGGAVQCAGVQVRVRACAVWGKGGVVCVATNVVGKAWGVRCAGAQCV